ncbi:hypothetical protein DICSQDRAFT_123371 [Dichomitus squalens LYAD-421 SS1]|uniref:uncharacterized protein n=1 Tax=Dichomitus squalens (strain LYAD-421) TaxID=732165 RepID=UPI0004415634|nr:uncharacterized protein DICSQDRAFT_123371 [Dichomitus squalens LYAD-421 SS1]EJF66820.1 hypothetical protein DICSQDRAFT_123371 [Dichomitus squalens LYAD-421 SS1]
MPPNAVYERTLHPLTAISTDFPVSGQQALYPLKRLGDAMHPSPILTEPPTPSSTATIRGLKTSQNTDDDILSSMSSVSRSSRTRSSSRTYRWIEDQQQHLTTPVDEAPPPAATSSAGNPYLAYPHMSASSLAKSQTEERGRGRGYVLAEQPNGRVPRGSDANVTQASAGRPDTPSSSTSTPRKARNSQGIFHASSPLRSLHLTFSSRRNPSAPVAGAQRPHSPASSASTGTFRRNERTASHSRGSSLSTVNALQRGSQRNARPELAEPAVTPPKTTAWKFKRPSVAGHFTPTPPDERDDSENGSPPPRPSTSSSVTHSGSSTTYARTSSDAPRKMYFGSIRSHSSTTIFSSSPSLWSLPTDATHINDPPESTAVIARDRDLSGSEGTPMTWKPTTPTTLPSVTSLLTSPKARRKRKLIISGIPPNDERRFDAVRKWCESFGELNSITRVPNGDLHIDFRKAEVADTVCRLNARVYIAGVGSVCLSWFTGKRP